MFILFISIMGILAVSDETHNKIRTLVNYFKKKEPETKVSQALVVKRSIECLERSKKND